MPRFRELVLEIEDEVQLWVVLLVEHQPHAHRGRSQVLRQHDSPPPPRARRDHQALLLKLLHALDGIAAHSQFPGQKIPAWQVFTPAPFPHPRADDIGHLLGNGGKERLGHVENL
jgi:hypothetical protein